MLFLLQAARVVTAALAVWWMISLLSWVPQVVMAGQFGPRTLLGIAVALLPAALYTWLTKIVSRRKQAKADGVEAARGR